MRYILGIDGGGTKTACILADETGNILGRSVAGASNHLVASGSEDSIREVLAAVIGETISRAGMVGREVDLACLALAGVGLFRKSEKIARLIEGLIPAREVMLENDAVAGLAGATLKPWGVVIAAGTGAIAVGINRDGERKRSGGWGHLLGDEGSGYWIAREGLNSASRAFDGRSEPTCLVDKATAFFRLNSFYELIRAVYGRPFHKEELAAFAPCVTEAAEAGDRVALAILQRAGAELGSAGTAVIHQLGIAGTEFDVALNGSVFKAGEYVIGPLNAKILENAPQARIVLPKFPPVIGAVLLGYWKLDIPVDAGIIARLEADQVE